MSSVGGAVAGRERHAGDRMTVPDHVAGISASGPDHRASAAVPFHGQTRRAFAPQKPRTR